VVLGVPPADVEAPLNSADIVRLPEPFVVLSTSTTTPSVPADKVVGVASAAVPEKAIDAAATVDVRPEAEFALSHMMCPLFALVVAVAVIPETAPFCAPPGYSTVAKEVSRVMDCPLSTRV
jgi:hypothetical protein